MTDSTQTQLLGNSPIWKKPDEVMQLHRLKRKKKALQERMKQPLAISCPDLSKVLGNKNSLNFSRILGGEKRKNPFSKNTITDQDDKKFCSPQQCGNTTLDESSDSTLFQLLALSNSPLTVTKLADNEKLSTFTNLLNKITKEQNEAEEVLLPSVAGKSHIPIDWSLKTKLRFMSPLPFAWNQKLKASEEASGITGYVRCLDTSRSCTLDTSHHARFHQNCLYWQHPSLPWLSLFPRTSGRVSSKNFIVSNEEIKDALHKEWAESFRSLFQLVRARQCPYFYVCANTFTCLFQAAGVGGQLETCAFLTPSTRGLRQTLKQEEIEYTMPNNKNYTKRKSEEMSAPKANGEEKPEGTSKNSSFDSCYDTMDNTCGQSPPTAGNPDNNLREEAKDDGSADEDDMESEQWLQSLGVAEDEIKKINYSQIRKNHVTESIIDSGDESLVFVQGAEAQALFNFLLNCKSSVPATGPFGGIPPTLLAPTAFQGGTLQPLKVRESIVHSEGGKYYSVELKGPILPTTVHSMCSLLQSNSNPFSGTFANLQPSVAFTKAAKVMADSDKTRQNSSNTMPSVFGRENLSDCGLNPDMLERFCSADPSTMETIDSLAYSDNKRVYTWS